MGDLSYTQFLYRLLNNRILPAPKVPKLKPKDHNEKDKPRRHRPAKVRHGKLFKGYRP